MKQTSPINVTYLGRRARVWTVYDEDTTNRFAARTEYTKWVDDATEENGSHPAGTLTARRVKGDPHKPSFTILEERRVVSVP